MLLLTALLVLAPGGGQAADPPKSVLTLSPPWINVFREDSVTLNCDSPNPSGDHVTQWFHNGTVLGIQTPSYGIWMVTFNDSGEYRCRMGDSTLSDPVRLDVYSDWLLLQTTSWVFLEGEPMVLRCHSWRNHPLFKVIFYQDGKALKFFHENSNFSIPQAKQSHSGSYFCSGFMGHERFTSSVFNITVQGRSILSQWGILAVFSGLGVAIAAAATATALIYFFKLRRKTAPSESPEHGDGYEAPPEDTPRPHEILPVVEDDGVVSYSLLKHTDIPDEEEEERDRLDYENIPNSTLLSISQVQLECAGMKLDGSGERAQIDNAGSSRQPSEIPIAMPMGSSFSPGPGCSAMPLGAALLVLGLCSGHAAPATKPEQLTRPSCATVAPGQRVTLKCEESPGPNSHKRKVIKPLDRLSDVDGIPEEDIGQQSMGYLFSRPFHLSVSYEWLILEAPLSPVWEGEALVLHCRSWRNWPLSRVTFYHDGVALSSSPESADFAITSAKPEDGGWYHCTGSLRTPVTVTRESAVAVAVEVRELFPPPMLRAAPSTEPREGSPLTLTCDTHPDPRRPDPRLRFSFYRDNRTVRGWDSSPEHRIPGAQSGDSGSYQCEVAMDTGRVWKRSPKLQIRVQRSSSRDSPTTPPPLSPDPSAPPECGPAPSPPTLDPQLSLLLQEIQAARALLSQLNLEARAQHNCLDPKISGGLWEAGIGVTMWVLTALLLLGPIGGEAATLAKPVVSLQPPWTTIFKGERVVLKCAGYHPLILEMKHSSILWYWGHLLLSSRGRSLEVQVAGVYRCQTRGTPVSDPIRLSVSSDWLILQVPYGAVFEGKALVLRCRGWYDKEVSRLNYYRNGQPLQSSSSSIDFTVARAQTNHSGHYQCSGTMRMPVESAPLFSAEVPVSIQELFPPPILRAVVPEAPLPGKGVTLTCMTRLHPQKRGTRLQFSFHKHSQVVRGWDRAPIHTLAPTAKVDNLDSYWCEAATESRGVQKRSPRFQLGGHAEACREQGVVGGPKTHWPLGKDQLTLFHHQAMSSCAFQSVSCMTSSPGTSPPLTTSRPLSTWMSSSPPAGNSTSAQGLLLELSTPKEDPLGSRHSAPLLGDSADPWKSQLILSPPSPILKGEEAKLTCSGSPEVSKRSQTTRWFKNNKSLRSQKNVLLVDGPGEYQCQTGSFLKSDPIFVEISQDKAILQAPRSLLEGDTLTLTCRTVRTRTSVNYFRNGIAFQTRNAKDPVIISSVKTSDSGNYTCSVSDGNIFSSKEFFSKSVLIYIEELFKTPQLEATPSNEPEEGTPVTLTCEVQPASPELQLFFSFYKESRSLQSWSRSPEYRIAEAGMRDSGLYWCQAIMKTKYLQKQSSKLQIWVQRFRVSGVSLVSQPPGGQVKEGERLVLFCSVAAGTLPITFSWHQTGTTGLLRQDVQRAKTMALEIPAARASDQGRYQCAAANGYGPVPSQWLNITVRFPVSGVSLKAQPPKEEAAEGQKLALVCSVAEGTMPVMFSWYREGGGKALREESWWAQSAVLELPAVKEEDAGQYWCTANNDFGPVASASLNITVTVPVSPPRLTLETATAGATVGDEVELCCEAQRGSPPIWYRFYHEDRVLGNSSVLARGAACFSLTVASGQDAGNYSCQAENRASTGSSEPEILSVLIPAGSRSSLAVGGGLATILVAAVTAASLVYFFKFRKKTGEAPLTNPDR
ncbi:Fc receptor-like protein 5 [Tachyglossus aculeatus]|uniref:Fc receptor-like protein 5 n=1 Tax=Tachyglossus aculeatus TaxID=9261 RepID=UPI0018F556F7|nr:Fc receptor-like protein 5 [Tachyglossus aculeatus]